MQSSIHYYIDHRDFQYSLGLSYAQKGFSIRSERMVDTFTPGKPAKSWGFIDYRNSYLSFPLGIRYQRGQRFYGLIGLELIPSVLLQSAIDNPGDWVLPFGSRKPSPFELSAQVEIGAGARFGDTWSLSGKLGYFRGFTTLYKGHYLGPLTQVGITSGITLSYRIK